MALSGPEQVGEFTQNMRADCFKFERAGQPECHDFVDRDCEMVRPEMHRPLGKRSLGGQRHLCPHADRSSVSFAQFGMGSSHFGGAVLLLHGLGVAAAHLRRGL